MLLYDCGNTSIKCYDNGQVSLVGEFDAKNPFYYINVNPNIKEFKNGIDLSSYFNLKSNYKGLGVDRVASCYAIYDGVVVDAGSAITVDVMNSGFHEGGFIMSGIGAYKESLASISSNLVFDLDDKIDFEQLPNSTSDALNFSLFKSIYLMIKDISENKTIYFCGGDGKFLSQFFKDSIYKQNLVFDGMIKVIKEIKYVNNRTTKRQNC